MTQPSKVFVVHNLRTEQYLGNYRANSEMDALEAMADEYCFESLEEIAADEGELVAWEISTV